MKKRTYTGKHLVLSALAGAVCALLCGILCLYLLLGPQCLTFLEAWGVIHARFVEDYDPDAALDSALSGLVDGLGNRWSYYLTAEEFFNQNRRRANSYVGVGITVDYSDPRGLSILTVKEGGPADEAGLLPGEIITAVDGASAAGEAQQAAVERIQGEEGTAVVLTLLDAQGALREVVVERRAIQNDSVSRQEMLPDGVGYIKLDNFYANSADQLNAAVDALAEQGARALVFDMRGNGGGYVDQLTQMLDHLLPEGPIFRTQDKSGREEVIQSDAQSVDLPMAVLVNGGTYSAAEFFAAQLRESVGAYVVGEETSGKGNSQQAFELWNGGALNLSTARYCTGAGVSLVGTGVTLDAQVPLDEAAARALQSGELAYEDDPQLQTALELLDAKD